MEKQIKEWERLTNQICEGWIKELWEFEEGEEVDWEWVNDDVGSIFYFADYYFSFSDVLEYYKLGVTKEQFLNWYDWTLCQSMELLPTMNLATFIKKPQEKEEQDKKYLELLKNRVKEAEEEFKQALDKYGK